MDEIPLSSPDITEAEVRGVVGVLRSGRLSIGPAQEEFETLVGARTGRQNAVAVSSGTAGLHLALLALGIGPGDEVITSPFSFIATANSIVYTGATPIFVDIDPTSLNMDPTLVEQAITSRTKAILAVETFGNPEHMDAYRRIAARHEIPLVEDACEGLGGSWRGRAVGAFGRVAVFGFYPNKQITTGEGGMIVTDDDALADLCRSMRNQGRASPSSSAMGVGGWLAHERLGFNYRLSELHAALGIVQMTRLDEILEKREQVAAGYIRRLAGHPHLVLPNLSPEAETSWFVFVVRLAESYTQAERKRVMEGMRRHDIGCAAYFPCIHLQPFYRESYAFEEGAFPIAESVSHRTIALPFHNQLTQREIDLVCQTLELMIDRENLSRT